MNTTKVYPCGLFLLALGVVFGSLLATAEDVLSAGDVVAMEWPDADARIAYGADPLQFGYLRLPPGAGPHPVVVFIHGGCYLSMFDIKHAGNAAQGLADAGYAVWSIEYRRVGDEGGGWPNTFLDVAAGADHLRVLARDYPIDLDRVFAAGHSAGANMALWLAARPRIPASSELHASDPFPIRGVLGLAPAANLETLHAAKVCGGVLDGLMGGSPEVYAKRYDVVSPMRLPPEGVRQRLIVGVHDASWGPSGMAYFELASADGRSPVTLREAPESGHFEMIVPTSSTWPIVLEELRLLVEGEEPAAGSSR